MKKRPDLSTMTHDEKDALILMLFARIEELERRLGLDSSNSSKPPGNDGFRKKPHPKSLRQKTGKTSGGQEGHEGKNLRQVVNPDKVIDHCPSSCSCGEALGIAQSTGYKKRQVFDIPKPQPALVTEHRAHSCRCARCGKKTESAFPEDVTAPAQYGANTSALVVYLQAWNLIPEDRVAAFMRDIFGVDMATSTIAAMAQRKAAEWKALAKHIGDLVKKTAVKHMDETGYRIAKALQWLHVASTNLLTFYRTGKRGDMLEGVSGIIVHDFWRSYFNIEGVEHALCNAHHLRELQALMDFEKEKWAFEMFRFLRHACHAANVAREQNKPLKPSFLKWLLARYDRIIAQGLAYHESLPPIERPTLKKRRGKQRRRTGHNLVIRLRDHKEMALRFLVNPDVPFSNNQAERDIRMMKLRLKISGCFRSETGADSFATLRTVLSTAKKQGWNIFNTLSQPTHFLVGRLRIA